MEMKKLLLYLLSFVFCLSQSLVDGIAFKVNNSPITLYELKELQKEKGISYKDAKKLLIIKAIKKQEMKRLQVEADERIVDEQIAAAAKIKGVSRDEFVSNMTASGYSYEELRDFYRDYIKEELLTQKILSTNLKIVDEKELKQYYDTHQKEFALPKEVIIIQYAAQNERLLAQAMNNPLVRVAGVDKREERVTLENINPQIAQMFASTPKGQFTQIINNGGASLAFYIKDKKGSTMMPYEQIKPMIMQQIVLSRKDKILEEYFDRLLASAIITEVRK